MNHEEINERSLESIKGLEPLIFWKYFYEISRIPHGSKNEKRLVEYIISECERLDKEIPSKKMKYEKDEIGNLFVEISASDEKYRNAPKILLQAHVDMVDEKDSDSNHDFSKDPLELVRNGEFITAKGTTLGADDGAGVAMMLMIIADDTLKHGPINLLFTVQEEIGLIGANSCPESFCEGDYLINLDGQLSIGVGCAGSRDVMLFYQIECESIPEEMDGTYQLRLTGLRGGHSGGNIKDYCGNSVKIFFRFYNYLLDTFPNFRISQMYGGDKNNAIPREFTCTIHFDKSEEGKFRETVLKKFMEERFVDYRKHEKDAEWILLSQEEKEEEEEEDGTESCFSTRFLQKLDSVVTLLPSQVIKLSHEVEGLVESSINLSSLKTVDNMIQLTSKYRSNVNHCLAEIHKQVELIGKLTQADVIKSSQGYFGWEANLGESNRLLDISKRVFTEEVGENPRIRVSHGGLEPGILLSKGKNLKQAISIGPNTFDLHSPLERMVISTVPKYYRLLYGIIGRISEEGKC